MKILIVSGFLGAGKTTFIRRLSRNIGKRFVILENEYGAAGIDGARLGKDAAEEGNIWEMTEQCICCSGKKDFASSVLTIANAVDPEYLIVEPTGVGRLSRIIENLKQIEYERIRLLSPVTIVDIHSFGRYLEEYPELYKDQIASAGTVIVSKTEQSGVEEKERIRKLIEKINPSAQIITDPYASMAREEFENFLKEEWGGGKIQKAETEEKLPDVFSLETVSMETPEKLLCFLEDMVRGKYGNIIRAKGQLQAGTDFLRFDVADSRYSVTGAEEKTAGKAVFIGELIKREDIEENFKKEARGRKMKYMARKAP